MTEFKHVLVPVDFGDSSRAALDVAIDLAKRYGASLTLVHCCEIPAYGYNPLGPPVIDLLTPVQDAGRSLLEETLVELRPRFPGADAVLVTGLPADEILAAASERRADLIVMGTHGRRGLGHVFMGSVAERVVRTSPVPVLTVRRPPA